MDNHFKFPVTKLCFFLFGNSLNFFRRNQVILLLIFLVNVAMVTAQTTTFNPVADTDTQSDNASGTNSFLHSSQWNHMLLRFDLTAVTGNVTEARLRLYQTTNTGDYTFEAFTTSTDTWSEGGAKPSIANSITTAPGGGNAGYKEIDITAYVQTKMTGNKIVSLGILTNLGSWTRFFSRQNSSNIPQLVLTTSSELTVTPNALDFNAVASSQNINISSNTNWNVSDNQSWINVSAGSGTNDGSVSVSVTANAGNESRSGTVTVSGGGITETVSVTQAGLTSTPGMLEVNYVNEAIVVDGNLNESDWANTPPTSISKAIIGSPNNTANFKVRWSDSHLYVAVTVEDASKWNDSSDPWEDDGIEIYIDGNNDKSTTYGSDDRQVIKVYNSAGIWTSSSIANLEHGIVNTSTGYTVEIGIPWSGIGVTASSDKEIGFDVGLNDDDNGNDREHQSMWSGNGDNWSNTSAYGTLYLVGAPPVSTLTIDPTSISFGSDASSETISVTSNVNWNATDNQSWISVSPGSGANDGSIAVSVSANPDTDSRNGTVTVTGGGITQTVEIQQEGATPTPTPGELDINVINEPIIVDGNLSESDWTNTPPTPISKTIIGTPNNTANFKARWSSSHLYVAVEVNDASKWNDSSDPWEDDGVEIYIDGNNNKTTTYGSDDRQIIKLFNGSDIWTSNNIANLQHGAVNTATGYTVEVGIPWSSLGVSASTNKEVGFDIGLNDDDNGGGREHQSMWNGTGDNWSNTSAFGTLHLEGTPPVTYLTVDPTSINFNSGASSQTITVTSNVSWNASDNQSWISVNPDSGSDNGNVTVSVTPNSSTGSRSGTVTINGGGISHSVAITQTGSPPTPGTMGIGTNFWFLALWSGETPFTTAQPNFAAAWNSGTSNYLVNTNIWNSTFIDEISIYSTLRFMDWGGTNNSNDVSWSGRRLPQDPDNYDAYGNKPGGDGLAYEWMIDLCNRTDKDMWVCLPHLSNANYWSQLATLIRDRLKPGLKVYVEYSNETWNTIFDQTDYAIEQGVANNLPGFNQWYQGGAFSIWQSLKIFQAFSDVFGSEMSSRVVRVCSFSGNFDIFDQGYGNVVNSSSWNPSGQKADLIAVAPYIGHSLNGASSNIQSQFREEINDVLNGYVMRAKDIADKYNVDLGCYEGGQHLTTNADQWSGDQDIYDEYIYMLNEFEPYFKVFTHYTNAGTWSPGGAWGAKEFTGQSPAQAPKYRALADWVGANSGASNSLLFQTEEVPTEKTLENELDANGVNIYPNPATKPSVKVTLLNEYTGPVEVTIVDQSGLVLEKHKAAKTNELFELDVMTSEFKSGVYYIRVKTRDNFIIKKLMKEQ